MMPLHKGFRFTDEGFFFADGIWNFLSDSSGNDERGLFQALSFPYLHFGFGEEAVRSGKLKGYTPLLNS